jgi:hypothetical protein
MYKTKTQRKKALFSIIQKAQKLTMYSGKVTANTPAPIMSSQDFIAIEKICNKYLKKL